jgi:hypothetical protein
MWNKREGTILSQCHAWGRMLWKSPVESGEKTIVLPGKFMIKARGFQGHE